MKRFLSLALAAVMLCSFVLLPEASAASGDEATIQQVVQTLGIITGDESGNLNLSKTVTRAEFAKMLVSASTYKDSVAATGNASPFKDVPYTHWAANYIKTAVGQGWLTGYLDGTYRPENPVTAAEAASAVLKLLGYQPTDLSGAFPTAQMALFGSTGLSDGLSVSASTAMTRQSCMRMFYNLLSVKTKDGTQKYMQVLGYKLDTDGNPDYNDLLQATMDGPVVLTAGDVKSTVGFTPTTVYRNGAVSSASAIQTYDVLYYAAGRQTVWAYSRRVTGTFEAATPSKDNPTTITVAGQSYSVTSANALYQLGTEGGLPIGANVTLLLGKNGDVVAAYAADKLSTELVGLVTAQGVGSYTAANGSSYTATSYTVLGVDGQTYTVQTETANPSVAAGSLVRVTYGASGTTVKTLSKNSLSGKVGTETIGSKKVASNISILDVTDTVGTRIYLSRLNGLTLDDADVAYYELNASGEIESLILNNVTGDAYTYGIVLSASENVNGTSVSASYTFLIDGQKSTMSTNGSSLGLTYGPARFIMSGNQVSSIRALEEIRNITSVTSLTIKNADSAHTISDHAAVYVYQNDTYTQLDKNELNLDDYSIRAYCDKDDTDGGRVRIIVATPVK